MTHHPVCLARCWHALKLPALRLTGARTASAASAPQAVAAAPLRRSKPARLLAWAASVTATAPARTVTLLAAVPRRWWSAMSPLPDTAATFSLLAYDVGCRN